MTKINTLVQHMKDMVGYSLINYILQGSYVFSSVCLSVYLFVSLLAG